MLQDSRYILQRVALKIAILGLFVLARPPGARAKTAVTLSFLAAGFDVLLATVHREPILSRKLNYWHEAAFFLGIALCCALTMY